MKHLLSWRVLLILTVAGALGACRSVPPEVPPTPSVPKPHDPTRTQPKPRALAPARPFAERPAPLGQYFVEPYRPETGQPRRADPGQPWGTPGDVRPLPRPVPLPRQAPELLPGEGYRPNPGLPGSRAPGQNWGSPGDTVTPRLEYQPLALDHR